MINITKTVLKRPVTAVICILALVFFGFMSLKGSKMELTPAMDMPMLIVTTIYPGASPTDVDENVTKDIEEAVSSMDGVDTVQSSSSDNMSMVMIQYEYGTDMDQAYMDLTKKLNSVKTGLPDAVKEPNIMEMDINQMSSLTIALQNHGLKNPYNYFKKEIVPEIEKLSSVASVNLSGGNEEYVQVLLDPVKVAKYHLDINTIATLVGSASFSIPGGSTNVGSTEMTMSTGIKYATVEELNNIPISLGNGNILYLKDIATVTRTRKSGEAIGRYNGEDAIILSANKNNKSTDVELSDDVKATLDSLKANDDNFDYVIINDNADSIKSSVKTMLETIVLVVILAFAVLFLFYGDFKASLIVATSIPVSILVALIMMGQMGFSLNVITLGSLVIAVGMMVDNSIVVLESCFRAMEDNRDKSRRGYIETAIAGTKEVAASVLGSTITTCVVFLPLGLMSGLSGQMFKPLGFTIVFCMLASLLSALSIVPLCFVYYKPGENPKAPAFNFVRNLQRAYRGLMAKFMKHKKSVIIAAVALFFGSIVLAITGVRTELMPSMDMNSIQINVDMKPNLSSDKKNEIFKNIEDVILEDEDVDNVLVSGGITGGEMVMAYLKDDAKKTTDETINVWQDKLQYVDDCDINVQSFSMSDMLGSSGGYSVMLKGTDYDDVKSVSDNIVTAMKEDKRLTRVSSTLGNFSPIIKIKVDPILAAAEGLVPAQVAGSLYSMMEGTEATTLDIDGTSYSVMVEYPEDEYDDINKVKDILFTTPKGNQVYLRDIADIVFEDSPSSISKSDQEYNVTISAEYTNAADMNTGKDIDNNIVAANLIPGVSTKIDTTMKMMNDEFASIGNAIVIAIFLVFAVMAMQFESPRFSIMVMATIPFAMVGSFAFLWLFNISMSMTSLMGMLMLIGTVVNNGILYIDTVDQKRKEMDLDGALVEAGSIRLRPILMTTLTTILSMVPLTLGLGDAGEMMQGLAMVDVGGMITSTVMALLVLPILYYFVNGKRERTKIDFI